ncbi:MAG: hypothetical protein NTV51_27525 [Verrucomicrobia bacterium]|nr:hypothetical protein [Verrucomicrobiota bacterium]
MNPNPSPDPWSRLTASARPFPDKRDTAAPYGFATRVAALAMAQERKVASLFERFAFRALGAACLLALLSVLANYSALNPAPTMADDELTEEDPVAVLLDS